MLAASDSPDWYDLYVHRRKKYYSTVDSGAVAFVYSNHLEGCLPPTGSVGTEAAPSGRFRRSASRRRSVRDLREQAILVTELVVELAREETAISHRSPTEVAEQLESENRAEGMRVVGDWPYRDGG